MGFFQELFGWPSGAEWADITADLISAAIGGLVVFIIRDHLIRRFLRLWEKHSLPSTGADMSSLIEHARESIHEKLDDLHGKVTSMQEEFGNGFLQGLQDKIEMMESKLGIADDEDPAPVLAIVADEEEPPPE